MEYMIDNGLYDFYEIDDVTHVQYKALSRIQMYLHVHTSRNPSRDHAPASPRSIQTPDQI